MDTCTYQFTAPDGTVHPPVALDPATFKQAQDPAIQGRAAWRALHLEALQGSITPAWLAEEFFPMIPRYGCTCAKDWPALLEQIPFRASDQFAWSVEIHNAVNQKLGKPLFTVDQAKATLTQA
jgi:hypothetical protein